MQALHAAAVTDDPDDIDAILTPVIIAACTACCRPESTATEVAKDITDGNVLIIDLPDGLKSTVSHAVSAAINVKNSVSNTSSN